MSESTEEFWLRINQLARERDEAVAALAAHKAEAIEMISTITNDALALEAERPRVDRKVLEQVKAALVEAWSPSTTHVDGRGWTIHGWRSDSHTKVQSILHAALAELEAL